MQYFRPFLSLTTALVLASLHGAGCSDTPGDPAGNTSGGGPSGTGTGGGSGTEGQQCAPSGGGPHWLEEGETVTFPVSCATGLELPADAFEVGPLPDGAVYDPIAREVTFSPGLDQAAVYEIEIRVAQLSEVGRVKIGVADNWADPANVPVADPTRYPEEYGLPVLFLSPAPVAKEYAPATVVYRGHTYAAEAELRGESSLSYPKNSYTLKFPKDDKFNEPEEAGGLTDRRKVVLISTFDDNSYIRQRLAYDLWNRLDPEHIQIKAYSAVVYLDGQYLGLYTVTDHVDGYLMEDHGFSQDGNLYKAVSHDANFALTTFADSRKEKDTLHDGYEKKEGTPPEGEPGAFDDLEELVSFVASTDHATFRSGIGSRIDQRDYEDWWIFVTFIMADDSAGKNSYHYRDPAADGVFRYAPWDFNASFGQSWETERIWAPMTVDYQGMNGLFRRFLNEPTIADPLQARYGQVLHGVFDDAAIQAIIDGYVERIDASARRDEARWGEVYRSYEGWSWREDFTTYEEEIAYVKAWISERWQYQDALY
ncbi:CotH kinase family protein [Sorangium sp. So ce131]|uniref:CotH kinase family protein n=1 Tax=Sorangium sp. So ce131 TaxID=3133282 RepID=UPI003F5F3DF3